MDATLIKENLLSYVVLHGNTDVRRHDVVPPIRLNFLWKSQTAKFPVAEERLAEVHKNCPPQTLRAQQERRADMKSTQKRTKRAYRDWTEHLLFFVRRRPRP